MRYALIARPLIIIATPVTTPDGQIGRKIIDWWRNRPINPCKPLHFFNSTGRSGKAESFGPGGLLALDEVRFGFSGRSWECVDQGGHGCTKQDIEKSHLRGSPAKLDGFRFFERWYWGKCCFDMNVAKALCRLFDVCWFERFCDLERLQTNANGLYRLRQISCS